MSIIAATVSFAAAGSSVGSVPPPTSLRATLASAPGDRSAGGWRRVTVPAPYAALDVTACMPGTSSCVAAIGQGSPPAVRLALVRRGRWRFGIALPSAMRSLISLSCASAAVCYALGRDGGRPEIALGSNDATTWSLLSTSLAVARSPALVGMSCVRSGSCVAVGTAPQGSLPVAMWSTDGAIAWSSATLPSGSYELSSVSCASRASCVAVGDRSGPEGGGVAMWSDDAGTTWQRSASPMLAVAWQLQDVSCSSDTCVAVGTLPAGGPVALYSDDSGRSWRLAEVPASFEELDTVVCVDSQRCVAAGLQPDPGGSALIASSDGGRSWVSQPVTVARGTFGSVSCSSTGCVAEAGGELFVTDAPPQPAAATVTQAQVVPARPMAGQQAAAVAIVEGTGVPGVPSGTVSFSVERRVLRGCGSSRLVATTSLGSAASLEVRGTLRRSALAACIFSWPSPARLVVTATYTGSSAASSGSTRLSVHAPGVRLVAPTGAVRAFDAPFDGPAQVPGRGAGVVGLASDEATGGYWTVSSSGTVRAYGAPGLGSSAGASGPVVAMASTLTGSGYYLLTGDGHVESFGDARSFGGLAGGRSAPAVGIVPTGFDSGYWIVDARGDVHAFGAAPHLGAAASGRQAALEHVVGIAATSGDRGYVLATALGKLVPVGDAGAIAPRVTLDRGELVTGIAADPAAGGYWLATSAGRLLWVRGSSERARPSGLGSAAAVAAA
ncbi:MAG TPA: hypothetical protein VMD59_08580 [Acidimicrobiales bacterium]|nr:hypothetical protein [Acidimicrobiales bacterium]